MWLKLLISLSLLTLTSACIFDSQCPRHGDCKWGECRCKYGVTERDSSGRVTQCEPRFKVNGTCIFDSQCPRYGDCKWGECRCKYGVTFRDISGKVTKCEPPIGFPMKIPLVVGMILFVVFMGVAVWVICYIRKKRLARSMTQNPTLWGAQNPPQSGPVPQGYPPPQTYPAQQYPAQQPTYPQGGYPAQQPFQPGYPPAGQGGPQPYGFIYNQDQPPPYNQATQYSQPH